MSITNIPPPETNSAANGTFLNSIMSLAEGLRRTDSSSIYVMVEN